MTSIYHINHTISLKSSQKDDLATALTELHTTTFEVPRLFAQVHFRRLETPSAFAPDPRLEDDAADHDVIYIGGRRQLSPMNHIVAEIALPAGFNRSRDGGITSDEQKTESQPENQANDLLKAVIAIWDRIVPVPVSRLTRGAGQPDADRGDFYLHSCSIREISNSNSSNGLAFCASYVAGVVLPGPSEGVERWAESNLEAFRARIGTGKKRKQDFDTIAADLEDDGGEQGDEGPDRDGWGTALLRGLIADVGNKGRHSTAGPEDEERRKRRKEEMEQDEKARREKAMKELEEALGWGEAA
jgi:hypothetical protein